MSDIHVVTKQKLLWLKLLKSVTEELQLITLVMSCTFSVTFN